jgi:hypothetical protein
MERTRSRPRELWKGSRTNEEEEGDIDEHPTPCMHENEETKTLLPSHLKKGKRGNQVNPLPCLGKNSERGLAGNQDKKEGKSPSPV